MEVTETTNFLESDHLEDQEEHDRAAFSQEISDEAGWWMELLQDHVQGQALIFAALKIWVPTESADIFSSILTMILQLQSCIQHQISSKDDHEWYTGRILKKVMAYFEVLSRIFFNQGKE